MLYSSVVLQSPTLTPLQNEMNDATAKVKYSSRNAVTPGLTGCEATPISNTKRMTLTVLKEPK